MHPKIEVRGWLRFECKLAPCAYVRVCSVKVSAFNNEIAPFFALSLSMKFPMKSKLAVSYSITFDFFIEFKLNTK